VNPGGGSGRDEPPLGIQIPDDARELDRDVLAYRREQRARRRRSRLRKLAAPFGGRGTILPLLASVLAVCLVAGAMLSVATFGPGTAPATRTSPSAGATSSAAPTAPRASTTGTSTTASSASASSPSGAGRPGATSPGSATSAAGSSAAARASGSISPAVP
jgi:hypothetical protein